MTDDQITQAAQLIAQGDFMEAMKIFENFIESNPDDPADTTDGPKQPYSRFK